MPAAADESVLSPAACPHAGAPRHAGYGSSRCLINDVKEHLGRSENRPRKQDKRRLGGRG